MLLGVPRCCALCLPNADRLDVCELSHSNAHPPPPRTTDPQAPCSAVRAGTKERTSLSAYSTEAGRRRLMIEDGLAAMLEWELENGPFSAEEVAAANKKVDEEFALLEKKIREKRRSA